MSEPFIAEVRIFPTNFAPVGWAFCDNQLLPIAQNTALFSLVGTTYGGNGQTTFALPELRGRVPVGMGQGPGLSSYVQGQQGGTETVTLTESQLPNHNHPLRAVVTPATLGSGGATSAFARALGGKPYKVANADTALSPQTTATAGGNQPHNNMMPYLALNFCISTVGIFPSRN